MRRREGDLEVFGVIECMRMDNPFSARDEVELAAFARLVADALLVTRRTAARKRLLRGCEALLEIRSECHLFTAARAAAREALGCRKARLLLATPDAQEL